jgi:hypothetical protein
MLAAGQWWLWYRTSDSSWDAYAVFALSEGELGSISDIQLNDVDIADLVGSIYRPDKYVLSYDDREGADTQTLPSFLTGTGGVPGLNETWPGLAYVAIKLKTTEDSPIPSSIRLTAKVTGRKISDFRGGAAAATSNPVVIAYDLLTNSEFGLARSTSLIDLTNWTAAADHCDTAMADSTKRYEWNGPLYERETFRAIQTVLGHAMMELQWDPEAGKYIIATSESGLSSVATIEESDLRSTPKWREIPLAERPNHVTVYYTREDTFDQASVTVEDPAGVSAADMRRIEIDLPGTYNASIATRFAVKRYNHAATERFRWFMRLGPVIADVYPGELVTLNTRLLSSQLARLVTKKLVAGTVDIWECEFVEYDAATDSTAVATEDTGISVVVDLPDAPTANTKTFGEAGDWDTDDLAGGPNDLSSWTAIGSSVITYDAVNEWTTITLPSGGPSGNLCGAKLVLPTFADTPLHVFTAVVECDGLGFNGNAFTMGWDGLAAQVQGEAEIEGDSAWHRYRIICRPTTSAGNFLFFGGAGHNTSARTMRVRFVRACKITFNAQKYLYERNAWTEHSAAMTTVDHYAAYDRAGFERGEVVVGETELEIQTLSMGSHAPPQQAYVQAFPGGPEDLSMVAVGPTGLTSEFPTPTIALEQRLFSGQVKGMEDVDTSGRTDKDVFQYDAASGEHKYAAPDALGITDAGVGISGKHTGMLSAAGDLEEAMGVLDDIPEDGLAFDNDVSVTAEDSGGSAKQVFKVTTADILRLGDPSVDLELYALNDVWISGPPLGGSGANLILSNGFGYYGRDTSARDREILGLDGSNEVNVGHASHKMNLIADGIIDADDNDIETTGNMEAAEGIFDRLQAVKSKTLTDGSLTEICRAFMDTEPAAASVTLWYEIQATDGTDIQCESGFVTFVMVEDSSNWKTGDDDNEVMVNVCSNGTLDVSFSVGTSGIDHARCRVNANSSLSSPTITGKFLAIGNAARSVTWS